MNTEALTAAAIAIHKAGGPKAPWIREDAWCDLSTQSIVGRGIVVEEFGHQHTMGNDADVVCLPACEAAVIAYVLELRFWWGYIAGGRKCSSLDPSGEYGWVWEVVDSNIKYGKSGDSPTAAEASAAIIIAISEALILAVAGEVGDD